MSSSTGLSITLFLYASVLLLFYTVYGAVYRLYLSPVSKFPGPRLAALTFWYEFYYDVVKRGQYTWKIRDLHRQYGPVVRVNPFELHVNDPEFYDQIYTGPSKKTDKWAWSAIAFGTPNGIFGTVPHELHRKRRGVLNNFFSKQAVSRLGPNIQALVDKLCDRFRKNYETKQPIDLHHIFSALTTDVITEYCFAASDDCLGKEDLDAHMTVVWMKLSEVSFTIQQFPWLLPIVNALPVWAVRLINPRLYEMVKLDRGWYRQIDNIRVEEKVSDKSTENTIFHKILRSDLDPQERTTVRLVEEARTLIGAGTITTANALKVASYHLLANPRALQLLTAELKTAIPDPAHPPSLPQLEQLPYLSAVINEGLRFSSLAHRMQRIAPDRPLLFHEWVIPPGTPLSMTSFLVHHDASVFPSPDAFMPERWLGRSEKRLDRYLVPFSKGTRACLGMNLALAEIYVALANVFRRFELELWETEWERDVRVTHDFVNPFPSMESPGVRVLVKGWWGEEGVFGGGGGGGLWGLGVEAVKGRVYL
ncbi:MAG: P450 monooxygenase [Lasallia pustulata]|uniref:P450 monooxygenase n=1 Tax=Lasallia pustulata TaxID=136370 RepID=A0A5M8PWX4_9LECA|nr:MAG: P450 monooxygenase [Lasallia pustulata]